MIEVKHIDKSFGDKAVLRDINAVFDDGKTNLIIGQSGAGKTVLMKILVGLLDPTGGEVLYDVPPEISPGNLLPVPLRLTRSRLIPFTYSSMP